MGSLKFLLPALAAASTRATNATANAASARATNATAQAAENATDGACGGAIACGTIAANGLVFSCRTAGPANGTGVLLLHGFPEWSAMYAGLMETLAAKGYRSVACNQRGYSPGARPSDEAAYFYPTLAADAVAVAAAAFGATATFHLVGHDHGALLGWTIAATHPALLRSYTSLSIPHPDAFSAGLYGETADLEQQMASQYFTTFVLNNSASLHFGFYYHAMAGADPTPAMGAFESESEFQRALWWYNGAFDAGVMAMPPVFSAAFLLEHGAFAAAALREMFEMPEDGGAPQKTPTGAVAVDALYVCGTSDAAILCDDAYARATAAYVAGDYRHLAVDCGHDLLACDDDAETAKVVAAVVSRLA